MRLKVDEEGRTIKGPRPPWLGPARPRLNIVAGTPTPAAGGASWPLPTAGVVRLPRSLSGTQSGCFPPFFPFALSSPSTKASLACTSDAGTSCDFSMWITSNGKP